MDDWAEYLHILILLEDPSILWCSRNTEVSYGSKKKEKEKFYSSTTFHFPGGGLYY